MTVATGVGFTLYPHQHDAVEEILDAFTRVPIVVLDGPTGSGKTIVGDAVRRRLGCRGLYVCSSRSLQDQFLRDFPTAAVLKGRSNYATQNYPDLFDAREGLSCADCSATEDDPCLWCDIKTSCPYERSKAAALRSPCAVLNTTYWLTEANGPGSFRKTPLVVIDECDLLEEEVMRYVGVKVSERAIQKYRLRDPKTVRGETGWKDWVARSLDTLRARRVRGVQMSLNGPETQLAAFREAKRLQNLTDGLRAVLAGMEGDGSWVYDGRYGAVEFKPVLVDTLGERLIWNKMDRALLMSATVISSENMLRSLGYNGRYETVTMPSTFPIANRPVRVMPVGEVKGAKDDRIVRNLAQGICAIASRHSQERILVHTVSFDLGERLTQSLAGLDDGIGRPLFRYLSSADRERVVAEWEDSPAGILCAPSMARGVDLVGDRCRVQVIAKVPYPNLGDRQVSKRLHSPGGQVWYTVTTIRTVVQMCGRVVRTKEDKGTTYILDSQFGRLWRNWKGLFPEWFQEAVVW